VSTLSAIDSVLSVLSARVVSRFATRYTEAITPKTGHRRSLDQMAGLAEQLSQGLPLSKVPSLGSLPIAKDLMTLVRVLGQVCLVRKALHATIARAAQLEAPALYYTAGVADQAVSDCARRYAAPEIEEEEEEDAGADPLGEKGSSKLSPDACTVCHGVASLLRQCDTSATDLVLLYVGNAMRGAIETGAEDAQIRGFRLGLMSLCTALGRSFQDTYPSFYDC
ncbi:hypothetical protein KIPB_008352, partial [Kipferlia bialata]